MVWPFNPAPENPVKQPANHECIQVLDFSKRSFPPFLQDFVQLLGGSTDLHGGYLNTHQLFRDGFDPSGRNPLYVHLG